MIDRAQLYLLRHGVAGGKFENRTPEEDFVRPLTKKGVRQSINAGKLLRRIAPRFDGCYCSPAVRCAQSAVLACQELKGVKPKPKKELASMSNSEGVALIKDGGCVLLVCHGPEMDDLIKHLTKRVVDISRGTIAGISIKDDHATLDQLLSPKQIASMVKPSRASGRAASLSEPVSLALAGEHHSPPCARRPSWRLSGRRQLRRLQRAQTSLDILEARRRRAELEQARRAERLRGRSDVALERHHVGDAFLLRGGEHRSSLLHSGYPHLGGGLTVRSRGLYSNACATTGASAHARRSVCRCGSCCRSGSWSARCTSSTSWPSPWC
jgi:phosphohistidine phosphatase SixA